MNPSWCWGSQNHRTYGRDKQRFMQALTTLCLCIRAGCHGNLVSTETLPGHSPRKINQGVVSLRVPHVPASWLRHQSPETAGILKQSRSAMGYRSESLILFECALDNVHSPLIWIRHLIFAVMSVLTCELRGCDWNANCHLQPSINLTPRQDLTDCAQGCALLYYLSQVASCKFTSQSLQAGRPFVREEAHG